MKKMNLAAIVALVASLSGAGWMNAEDVVVAYLSNSGNRHHTTVERSELSALRQQMKLGADITPSNKKRPILKDSPSQGGDGFRVTFAVEDETFDGFTMEPWKVYVTQGDNFGDAGYYNYAYYPDEYMIEAGYDWWGCYVPEGTFNVILSTGRRNNTTDFSTNAYIVKEDVEIKSDTTITFRQSDAKNLLSAKFRYPDGSLIQALTQEDYKKKHNAFFRCLNNSKGVYCFNMMADGWPFDSIYVNNLSADWTYAINQVATDEHGSYVNKLVIPGPFTEDMEFTNDPKDYVEKVFHFDPVINTNDTVAGHGVATFMTWKGADWSADASTAVRTDGDYTGEVKLFINDKKSDLSDATGYDVFVAPIIGEYIEKYLVEGWDGQIREYQVLVTAKGAYSLPEDNGEFLFIDGTSFYRQEEYPGEKFYLPSVSPFSFKANEVTYFTSAPLVMLDGIISYYADWLGCDILNCFESYSYPLFEAYGLDGVLALTNGNQTTDFTSDERIWDWAAEGNYTPGPVSIDVTAPYKMGDDGACFTIGSFNFDTSYEAYTPPMTTRWQLRDASNIPSVIANPESKIIFAVYDYDEDLSLVKLQYNVAGSEEWQELQIKNVPVFDSPETYGSFFEAKFGMTDYSEPVTLNIRFIAEDKAGNSSVQTIEKAFLFDSQTGIRDVKNQPLDVRLEGNNIIAPAGSIIATPDGRLMQTGHNLPSGIYIVCNNGKSVKVFVR